MTKKKKIKLLKIATVVVWLVLLLLPIFTTQMEEVKLTGHDMTFNANTGKYDCTLTCDKNFVSGTAKIAFYGENNIHLKTVEKEFDENEGNTVVIVFEDIEIPDDVYQYKVEELKVTTDTQETIQAVCWLFAIILAVALVFVLRLVVLEYTLDGKQVEVYAGVRKKTMRINGELVAETKKMFNLKPVVLTAKMGEKDVIAEIRANNRIVLYSKDNTPKGEVKENPKVAYEMTDEEKEFFKKMEEEGILETNSKKETDEMKVLEVEEPAETIVDEPDGEEELVANNEQVKETKTEERPKRTYKKRTPTAKIEIAEGKPKTTKKTTKPATIAIEPIGKTGKKTINKTEKDKK